MTNVPLPQSNVFELRRVRWIWHVFGKIDMRHGYLSVEVTYDPPLWRRIITRIFMGSVWERIGP